MKRLKVFYDPRQSVKDNESFSPSAGKPAKVLESWKKLGLPIEVKRFQPLTESQISLAHDPLYVRAVLDCKTSNGFGNRLESVARSLPYTTGSIAAAALYAAQTGNPAASLTSGFHHSCYDSGGGFCTFNGLVIAAQLLRLNGFKKIGILDCDMHYGNGTQDIIRKLGLDYIKHWTFGHHVTEANAEKWLCRLKEIVCKFREYDVLLFQAGADPHVKDPLGGVLTSKQMRLRDRIVFKTAKEIGLPVAWNLAGGYQEPIEKVLKIHNATVMECISAHTRSERKAA